jgi:hypothetical protein
MALFIVVLPCSNSGQFFVAPLPVACELNSLQKCFWKSQLWLTVHSKNFFAVHLFYSGNGKARPQ